MLRLCIYPALAASLAFSPAAGQELRQQEAEAVDVELLALPENFGSDEFPVVSLPNSETWLLSPEWLKKQDQVTMPIGLDEAGASLTSLAESYLARCREKGTLPCIRADGYGKAANRMQDAADASPLCDESAAKFRVYYKTANPPTEVARAYDLECLGSITPRIDANGVTVQSSLPKVFQDAESFSSFLPAVGILEAHGAARCTGLLRPNGTFITARHCLEGADGGQFAVRSSSGKLLGESLSPAKHPEWQSIGVPADWVLFKLMSPSDSTIPHTNLIDLDAPREVSLVGIYLHAESTTHDRADPLPLKALRFPKDGMCQALLAYSGCLQLGCQTIRGFSGAPIVSGRRDDGSFDVVGFVSRSVGMDYKCMGEETKLANSTFAVSGHSVERGIAE